MPCLGQSLGRLPRQILCFINSNPPREVPFILLNDSHDKPYGRNMSFRMRISKTLNPSASDVFYEWSKHSIQPLSWRFLPYHPMTTTSHTRHKHDSERIPPSFSINKGAGTIRAISTIDHRCPCRSEESWGRFVQIILFYFFV